MSWLVLWGIFLRFYDRRLPRVFVTREYLYRVLDGNSTTLDSTGSSLFIIICLSSRLVAYRYSGIIYVFCKLWEK